MAHCEVMSSGSNSSDSMAETASIASARSLEATTTQTTPLQHTPSIFDDTPLTQYDKDQVSHGSPSSSSRTHDVTNTNVPGAMSDNYQPIGVADGGSPEMEDVETAQTGGVVENVDDAVEAPAVAQKNPSDVPEGRQRPDILDAGDEFWGTSPDRQRQRRELENYMKYLEEKALDYNYMYYEQFTASVAGHSGPAPQEELDTDWTLELRRERIVQDSSGLDGLPQEDIGELKEQSLRAKATGGPILRRTREFDVNYQHRDTKIEIRSPLLVEALREAISAEDHPEYVSLHYNPVVFRAPYMLLFQYWADIVSKSTTSEGDKQKHIEFLLTTLEKECPMVAQFATNLANKTGSKVPFQALWTLYRPGTTVFRRENGALRAYIVEAVSGGTDLPAGSFSALKLCLRSSTAALGGKSFVQTYDDDYVEPFAADLKIEKLKYVPAGFLPQEKDERVNLLKRGKRYTELMRRPQVMEYKGNEWKKTWEEDTSRVVIDVSMETAPARARDEDKHDPYAYPGRCPCGPCNGAVGPRISAVVPKCTCAAKLGPEDAQCLDCDSTNDHLYLPPDIFAFSLIQKTWRSIDIGELDKPVFEDTMMTNKLVIPKDHKEVVTSLVSSYTNGDFRFSDFVKGKGRGLVILLHGSPGTGKTLTAGKSVDPIRVLF